MYNITRDVALYVCTEYNTCTTELRRIKPTFFFKKKKKKKKKIFFLKKKKKKKKKNTSTPKPTLLFFFLFFLFFSKLSYNYLRLHPVKHKKALIHYSYFLNFLLLHYLLWDLLKENPFRPFFRFFSRNLTKQTPGKKKTKKRKKKKTPSRLFCSTTNPTPPPPPNHLNLKPPSRTISIYP